MRRTRYQDGSLRLRERSGENTWEYRWYEVQVDGSRKRCSVNLGTIQHYPTEAAALKAASALRANINMETPRTQLQAISFETLVEHYRLKEMGEGSGKTFATVETYEGYLRRWILPRWKSYRLRDVKPVSVEEWLKTLPLTNGSRAKIRNMMHAIFNHAIRWGAQPQPHHPRSSERETLADPGRSERCSSPGTARQSSRTRSYDGVGGCINWVENR